MRLDLGTAVICDDGPFGELADVVIDSLRLRVTHLVVQPRHGDGLGRLVPIELASPGSNRSRPAISLHCPIEKVRALPFAQEMSYVRLWGDGLPTADPDWDVGIQEVLTIPRYGYEGLGGLGPEYDAPLAIRYDLIPKGEVEIRSSSPVSSADGHFLGHVEGLLVDPDDRITHVVLERGHLWGHREVTIPVGEVKRVETDSVTLSLSKDAVAELPSVPVHRWRERLHRAA